MWFADEAMLGLILRIEHSVACDCRFHFLVIDIKVTRRYSSFILTVSAVSLHASGQTHNRPKVIVFVRRIRLDRQEFFEKQTVG